MQEGRRGMASRGAGGDGTAGPAPEALFKALADANRLRCLALLAAEGELCVCELAYALGAPQPRVSRHLGHLRQAGLVEDRRAGQWVYYRLRREGLPGWVEEVLGRTLEALRGRPPYARDLARLRAMPGRPGAPRCA